MNRLFKMTALVALLGSSIAAHAAGSVVDLAGGTINFNGSVVDAACAVNVNSANQDISLGQVRLADFTAAGAKSPATSVKIELDDCDPAVAATATFKFTGQADSADATSLANVDAGASAATGVGVQMTDISGGVVPIDGSADAGSAMTLVKGTNNATFSAYMIATNAAATAGSLHSTVDFTVEYQ